jgi:hypothetical protein
MSLNAPDLYQEIFNQRAAILTFFGALGGSVRAAVLKTTWKESLRVIFVGGAVAFGVGVLGPFVLEPWIGDIPHDMTGALGTLTATSFILGLVAVTLVERFVNKDEYDKKVKEEQEKYNKFTEQESVLEIENVNLESKENG